MEYVDGEDLASLLRRIGRLPEDKAIEIARQLCAGLAAAHDEGVLHRDLKPANVMLDGRGRAKITDFGLAGATAGISGHEARAGTPQYMAPEQFDGRELTVQTDLYSLGLVLYELFTGKRAFESRDRHELSVDALVDADQPVRPRRDAQSDRRTRHPADVVDPDPARRPRSAASLAAALPGGDPLAMAIAAGETPSPEMVARSGGRRRAQAGDRDCRSRSSSWPASAPIWFTEGRTACKSRAVAEAAGGTARRRARGARGGRLHRQTRRARSNSDSQTDGDYFEKVEKTDQSSGRWKNLATVTPVPVLVLVPGVAAADDGIPVGHGQIDFDNPPFDRPGMVRVRVDPSGRLQDLRIVPKDLAEAPGPYAEPDWTPLFGAAGYIRE